MTRAAWTTLAVGQLLGLPSVAPAQTFLGLSVGINSSGPQAFYNSFSPGVAVQASLGRHLTPRLGMRLDAYATSVDWTRANSACAPGTGGVCPADGFVKPVGVAGLTVSGLLELPGVGLYLIGGAGVGYWYEHPSAQGAVCPDLSAGVGLVVPVGHMRIPIEARLHRLISVPTPLTWFVPMTVGIEF